MTCSSKSGGETGAACRIPAGHPSRVGWCHEGDGQENEAQLHAGAQGVSDSSFAGGGHEGGGFSPVRPSDSLLRSWICDHMPPRPRRVPKAWVKPSRSRSMPRSGYKKWRALERRSRSREEGLPPRTESLRSYPEFALNRLVRTPVNALEQGCASLRPCRARPSGLPGLLQGPLCDACSCGMQGCCLGACRHGARSRVSGPSPVPASRTPRRGRSSPCAVELEGRRRFCLVALVSGGPGFGFGQVGRALYSRLQLHRPME